MIQTTSGIKRKKLSQEIAEQIMMMVAERGLAPGDQVPPEGELATLFCVSRTPIREAIKTLAALGAVQVLPGKGIYVQDMLLGPLRNLDGLMSEDRNTLLLDLIEFRRIIEPEVAALAAVRRNDSDLAELQRCVVALAAGILRHVRPAEDLGFHTALARAARNTALADVSGMIGRFYRNDPHLPDEGDVAQHDAIYQAVRDCDPERARRLMLEHLDVVAAHQMEESDARAEALRGDPRSSGNAPRGVILPR